MKVATNTTENDRQAWRDNDYNMEKQNRGEVERGIGEGGYVSHGNGKGGYVSQGNEEGGYVSQGNGGMGGRGMRGIRGEGSTETINITPQDGCIVLGGKGELIRERYIER